MPSARHDFRCPACGFILRDHVGAQPVNDPSLNPRCPKHQWPLGGTRMEWIPQARFSGFSDASAQTGRHATTKAEVLVDDPGAPGGFRREVVSSLADIRRLERESEVRSRNGEGQQLVWRDYAQDANNSHTHTLMADPSLTPSKTTVGGAPVTVRRGDAVTAEHGKAD